ncbi:HAD-IA family hydrolase [archaeon]|jgi:HAD superfamily hydrolase (TIGR01509 family)|nr:HAD-IA family hydrolase [archaeon]MBT6761673.1 HAD-IA family hydrolase [archaeon]
MIKVIIFDLWETLGTKNVGISSTLLNHFGFTKNHDLLVKYENAIQLKKFSTVEDLATSFLSDFELDQSQENIKFVVDTLQAGVTKATIFDGIYELLEELAVNYRLGLVSNTTVFESKLIFDWKIDHFFDVKIFSWEIGLIKPDPKVFGLICSKLDAQSSDVLFIDDGSKNVVAARKLGMQAIRFESVGQLKQELGVLLKKRL